MSGSVEVVLWLHEYELKALDKHLASNGTDVEKRMQEMLADLYSECVPFEERQAIQERINAEHAEAVADQMANTTWAAYHITGHGEDLYFKTSKADTLLTAAKRLRTYLTAEDNPQPATLAAVLKDRTEITQAEYDQLLDQRLQNTGQVSGVFEIDFDRDTFSAANATKELFEYSDYCASPTFGNASELITMALDANIHTMEAGDGYLKYIATRPRVEKRGDHGLFSDTQDVSLQDMMAEVAEHHGPVWTVILSLRREDASALGYDSAENWRTLLLQHRTRLAQAMKIPVDDFRWCAAFHDEGYHPHVHMMVWSADEKNGYLNKTGITAMRSALTNTIFQDEMHNLYVKKDLAYQDLVKQSRSVMAELIARMESTSLDNDSIARKMVELANALGSVKGKKQYGYLPKKLKELVDAITDELALQPDVAACYQVWNDLRDKLEGYYKDKPRVHNPLSKQKEFKAIKNSIIREADCLRLELEQEEMDSTNPNANEESGEIDSTETPPKTDSAQQPIKSPAVNNHNPAVIAAVTRLLYHMGQIFRDNAMAPTSPLGLRIDSKRRKKLMAKRLALGHKADDHEEQGWQNGPSM